MEHLNRLARMATALRHRERIIRISKEADDTAQQTVETMKRIMSKTS